MGCRKGGQGLSKTYPTFKIEKYVHRQAANCERLRTKRRFLGLNLAAGSLPVSRRDLPSSADNAVLASLR